MIRNLKVLLLAALALTAFGAISATGAHAAEEKFHCATAPCRLTATPDGTVAPPPTGATAHHVFVITDSLNQTASFTCKQITGDATSATTTSEEITLTGIVYDECNVLNNPVTVRMNECDYLFRSLHGAQTDANGAEVHVQCAGTKHIEIEIVETGCIFEVTPQTLTKGIRYHNINAESEVTVEANVPGIAVESVATNTKAKCVGLEVGAALTSKYTTGNTIVTGEPDPGAGMINVKFA